MTEVLSRLMPEAHAKWLVVGFYAALTAAAFAFVGLQMAVN
jgi:hypothetical protein